MKRSRNAKLTIMAAGSALALTACSSSEPRYQAETYRDLDSCLSANIFSDEQCQSTYENALTLHNQSAPRYRDLSLCEQEFGPTKCEQRSNMNGAVFWSPFMTGFLVSQVLDHPRRGNYYYSSPFYNPRRGGYYMWDGEPLVYSRGNDGRMRTSVSRSTIDAPPKPARVMTRTSVVSRGGFGTRPKARASSRSSRGGRGFGG